MKIHDAVAFPDADDFMWREMQHGTYQADHLDQALRHVKQHRVAIDAGAHVGLWSKRLSPIFERVIAVEPSDDTFEALRWNLAQWGLANVETHCVALGDRCDTVTMTLDAAQAARQNTGGRYAATGGHVKRITVDSWQLPWVDFLKLDIEGSEFVALKGAVQTLRRCRPVVLCEEKGLGVKYYGLDPNDVPRFFHTLGYHPVQRIGCDWVWRSRR